MKVFCLLSCALAVVLLATRADALALYASTAAGAPGELYILDPATGNVAWSTRLKGSEFWATPAASGEFIFCCSADGVVDWPGERSECQPAASHDWRRVWTLGK